MLLPCSYASGRTLDAFSSWITQKLDSDTTFARVESLDSLVRDYLGAGKLCLSIELAASDASLIKCPSAASCVWETPVRWHPPLWQSSCSCCYMLLCMLCIGVLYSVCRINGSRCSASQSTSLQAEDPKAGTTVLLLQAQTLLPQPPPSWRRLPARLLERPKATASSMSRSSSAGWRRWVEGSAGFSGKSTGRSSMCLCEEAWHPAVLPAVPVCPFEAALRHVPAWEVTDS